MKNFALIGAAGYIAPRHLAAIKATGNRLIAAVDKADNVGILDSYFPEAPFFTEFEQFERCIDLLRTAGTTVDYVSVTSPNYLHDSHIRFALRAGAHAICEKPLVLSTQDAEGLMHAERETGRRIYTILQLRLHPALVAMREKIRNEIAADPSKHYDVDLTYLTGRGAWYFTSWKGDNNKSGGIAANIGIHFFDMLLWLFGEPVSVDVALLEPDVGSGTIRFANATVKWFLSVNTAYLPDEARAAGKRTFRSIQIGDDQIEFSERFTELHQASYEDILAGNGFGIEEALPSLRLVERIRATAPVGLTEDSHAFVSRVLG